MKKIVKPLLSLSLAAAMSACSFNGSGDNANATYQKQKNKLEDSFEPIIGTYEGTMIVNDSTSGREGAMASSFPLQIGIYKEYISAGKDSQGQDQILPSLKIRYRQLDAIRADEILSARFINDTGEVTATDSQASSTNIHATLVGSHLIGEVIRASGKLGKFDLVLISKDVLSQSDAQNELYDRVVKMNRSLQGVYLGKMKVEPGRPEGQDFPVRIEIMAVETAENGRITSKLMGYYSRPDYTADPTAGERTLAIEYRMDTEPPQFVMSSSGGTTQIPNAYFMSIVGTIRNGTYTAEAKDRRGKIGILTVTKIPAQ